MRRYISVAFGVIVLAVIAGCGPSTAPTASPPTLISSPTVTLAPTTPPPDPCDARIAPTPTPLPEVTPGGPQFDPDIFPPLDVMHTPPAVLRPDEKAVLEFMIVCGVYGGPGSCQPEATLYAGWGDGPLELVNTYRSEFGVRVSVPATDEDGSPLRYYLEARDTRHNLGVRYPPAGCFQPMVAETPVEITLPDPQPVGAEVVLSLPWGQAEGQVGVNPVAMIPEGPEAFDVGADGMIAVLDNVNGRVIVARPGEVGTSSFPLPDSGYLNIAVDPSGQIVVLDAYNEPPTSGGVPVPRVDLYRPDGSLVVDAPVYVKLPLGFAGYRAVQDGSDLQLVTPFDGQNHALSRDEQRATRTAQELQVQYIDETHFMLADMPNRRAFSLSAEDELGALHLFERTVDGYMAIFQGLGVFRILRFDPAGAVQSYVEVRVKGIEWGSSGGFVAAGQDGSAYVMNAAGQTVEILRVSAPER